MRVNSQNIFPPYFLAVWYTLLAVLGANKMFNVSAGFGLT